MASKQGNNLREMEMMEEEREMTMAETAGETEIVATTSNALSIPAQLHQDFCMDHGSAGDRSGTECKCGNLPEAGSGKRRNCNQPFGIRD